jgi:enoyl-CoA hydratase
MGYETIKVETDGPIALVSLNRPQCLNAINFPLRNELFGYLSERMDDYDTRVIVLTGEGRGFCSGLDLKDPMVTGADGQQLTPERAYRLQKSWSDMIHLMRRIPQPLIAAVNGAAAGAGLSLSLACDIRLAAPEAKFSAAYINIGVGGADMGCSWLLPRLVGSGNASLFMMTGDLFTADEVKEMGLVQRIHEKDELLDEAMKLARQLSTKSALGLRLTKEAIDRNVGGATLEDALKLEDRNQAMCIAQLAVGASASQK